MGRKQADDPMVSVSLRVRQSVLEAYQADGDGWRRRMHKVLEDGLAINAAVAVGAGRRVVPEALPAASKPKAAKASAAVSKPDPAPFRSRLKGEWKAP